MRLAILTLATMIAVGGLWAPSLGAQGPVGPPDREPPTPDALQDYLQLTDLQLDELRTVAAELREAVRPIQQQIRDKQRELRAELRQEVSNTGLVGQIEVDIENLKNEAAAIRTGFMVRSRALLTSDQVAALDALENALALMAPAMQAARANLIAPPEDFSFGRGGSSRRRGGRGRMGGPRGHGPQGPVQ